MRTTVVSLITMLLIYTPVVRGQSCYAALEEIQKEFYKDNPDKAYYLDTKQFLNNLNELKKINQSIFDNSTDNFFKFVLDSTNKKTKYDDLAFRWYLDSAISFLNYSKTFAKSKILSKLSIGSLPDTFVTASAIPVDSCYVIICNANLFTFINEFTKISLIASIRDSNGIKQLKPDEYNIAKAKLKKEYPLQKRLDSLVQYYAYQHSKPSQKPIEHFQRLSINLVKGCEYFTIAHECAHAILKHSGAESRKSQIWEQELNADLLGLKLYLEALQNSNSINDTDKVVMYSAPILFFSMLGLLEKEKFYKAKILGYYPNYSEAKANKEFDIAKKYIKTSGNAFTKVDKSLDSAKALNYYDYPPAYFREVEVAVRLVLAFPENELIELAVASARNIELLWQYSKPKK